VVRAAAVAFNAEDWLDGLPSLLRDLEEEWAITLERPDERASEAFVADVTQADGTPAVLKLLVPRSADAVHHEITVLRLVGGEGCVRLLKEDASRGALLLERLGPAMFTLGLPFDTQLDLLCDTAAQVWRPAPDAGLPTGAAKGRRLVDIITRLWEELDRPCSDRALDDAVAAAERRIAAHDDEPAVLVHGDVHEWNALQADDGFRLVDPDGLLVEPEYDLGILMREHPRVLLAGDPWERARYLATRSGLDVDAIWEWGVVERLSTGLLSIPMGRMEPARDMLHAADVVAQ
jgi:streptomycin 6-kinase